MHERRLWNVVSDQNELGISLGFFPSGFRSFGSNLGTFRFGHGLEAELSADLAALTRLCENSSFAPLGLVPFPLEPTAYAVGCILTPLRG